VDATSRELAPQPATPVDPAGITGDLGTTQRASWRARFSRATPESVRETLDEDAKLRLRLQRRSQHNVRRQLERAVVRVSVLVVVDLAAFTGMRTLLRSVRDAGMLGPFVARTVSTLLPRGALSGWQFAAALMVGLVVTGNYGQGDRRRSAARLFLGAALAVALPLWIEIWTRSLPAVLIEYVLTTTLVWAGLVGERFTIDRLVALIRPPEQDALRSLFVGPASECRRAVTSPVFSSGRYYNTLGFVDTGWPAARDAVGCRADLGRLIHDKYAEAIVICGYLDDWLFQEVVDVSLSAGCELVSVPRTQNILGLRPAFLRRDGEPLVVLTAPALKGQQFFVKRAVDVASSFLALLVLSPLLLLIGAAIKLDSRGPVLFRQQRVGLGGRTFGVLKFRTMFEGADGAKQALAHMNHTGDPRLFKIPNDPRVTRVGRRLRRWSLDELPQLWNVLVGDMSLVGPRPFFAEDLAAYESHHFARLGAKPGITGLWQVSGRSAITDFEEVVRLDREYIETWSLWLDLKITLKTLPAVLRRSGAY